MNRPLVYTAEIVRAEDMVWGWRDTLEAIAQAVADIIGGSSQALFAGLTASATSPLSMNINVAPGDGYQFLTIDPTQNGPLPPSTDTGFVQGINPAQTVVTLSTSGLNSGQNMWALVEAQVQFSDVVRALDPSGGVLSFFNPANPSQPLQGQAGGGGSLPTERTAIVALRVKYGATASTGTEVPPNADSGWIGLYLIDLTFGQTQVTQAQILTAGPSVGTGVPNNYPVAPFLAGLTNSHHGGVPGQAPKIKLASEVQGTLPLGNLPASNTIGTLPTLRLGTGSPSGNVAGNTDDLWFDVTGNNLYLCKQGGTAATAVWNVAVTVAGAAPTGAAGGDLAGSYPNPSVAKVNGTSVPSAPAAGALLQASSSSAAGWVATSIAIQSGLVGLPGALGLIGFAASTTVYQMSWQLAIIKTAGSNLGLIVVGPTTLSCTVVGSQTGSTAGGRDQTAAFGANVFYHMYLIGGGGQSVALLASLSYGSPTLPTNYTSWAYLATLRTDGSANVWQQLVNGNKVLYSNVPSILVGGTATVPTAQGTGSYIPAQAQTAILGWQAGSNNSGNVGDDWIVHIQIFSGFDVDQFVGRGQVVGSGQAMTMSYKAEIPNNGQNLYYWFDNVGVSAVTPRFVNINAVGYTVPNGST